MYANIDRYTNMRDNLKFVSRNRAMLTSEATAGSEKAADILDAYYALASGDWRESLIDAFNTNVQQYAGLSHA